VKLRGLSYCKRERGVSSKRLVRLILLIIFVKIGGIGKRRNDQLTGPGNGGAILVEKTDISA
jgi:hypothetical protein